MSLVEFGRLASALLSAIGLGACSLPSLGGSVQSTSLDYATVFEQYSNQSILRNVLRASDLAPLSFADLPILHGSLNIAGSAGLSEPFGALHGASTRSGLTANISFGSSPTFDTNPLNTSGFSLLVIQPISPTFVVASWQSGLSKELLLRLFIESIEFTKCGQRLRIENDPESPSLAPKMTAALAKCGLSAAPSVPEKTLVQLIENAIDADLDLRLFTFYLPLGQGHPVPAIKDIVDASSSADAANLHVGNGEGGNLQVYRVAAGQALGCLDITAFNGRSGQAFELVDALGVQEQTRARATMPLPTTKPGPGRRPLPTGPASGRRDEARGPQTPHFAFRSLGLNDAADLQRELAAGKIATGNGAQTMALTAVPSAASKPQGAAGSAPTSKTTPGQAQQSVVQPGQISSVVAQGSCLRDPVVLKQGSEIQGSDSSEQGIVIHWRSISSVFRYVGAIVAMQRAAAAGTLDTDPHWSWASKRDRVGNDQAGAGREVLFDLASDLATARVRASYEGLTVGIPNAVHGGVKDHSLEVVALLTQLLNDSRIAGDIPTTQRLEIVP